jgi:hypothetical protein
MIWGIETNVLIAKSLGITMEEVEECEIKQISSDDQKIALKVDGPQFNYTIEIWRPI